MKIYCANCDRNVEAVLLTGKQVLPKVKSLREKCFWKCSNCKNFVGTRTVGKNELAPDGAIVGKKIRELQNNLRKEIQLILEAKKSIPNANELLYSWLSKKLFYSFRIAAVMSKEEAEKVMGFLKIIKEKI